MVVVIYITKVVNTKPLCTTWYLNGSPLVVTLGQQYNVGEKPTAILYTYINHHAQPPIIPQRNHSNTYLVVTSIVLMSIIVPSRHTGIGAWVNSNLYTNILYNFINFHARVLYIVVPPLPAVSEHCVNCRP